MAESPDIITTSLKKYNYILFDLDHTLWDFNKNSSETLLQLYDSYGLAENGKFSAEQFIRKFSEVNSVLWTLYDRNEIDKNYLRKERFKIVFRGLNYVNDPLAENLGSDYLSICPVKSNVIPYAHEILEYLHKSYKLVVITNGFPDVQKKKLEASGIEKYFIRMITSEEAGHKKPNRGIFNYGLKTLKAKTSECVMIGDNIETDIKGAKSVNMDIIFFNPEALPHKEEVTCEITSLRELKNIL